MRNFKKFLALLLATMMVLGSMVTVSAAEEAETEAAEEIVYDYTAAAEDLAALDIFKGKGVDYAADGEIVVDYALEDPVTRWQMALFIARIVTGETDDQYWNKVSDNTTPYDDVINYFGAISYVDENGIVKGKGWIPGVGDNCFAPEDGITLQDALTMAVRALGEKQLAYPNGFMYVAEAMGLTEGLGLSTELDAQKELNRGEVVQILKNMLYASMADGTSYAQKNFGLEEKIYVVVATELQYMVGMDRVERVDYDKLDTPVKYVALAALNADGSYNLEDVIHLTEGELGLEQGDSEYLIGYSFTLASYDEYATVYSYELNKTETFQNYGDNGVAIEAGAKYNNATYNSSLVKINGTTYSLVDNYSVLNNKASQKGKTPELIVHSMFKGESDITTQYYIYDTNFNILDPEKVADPTNYPTVESQIALMYNQWTNTYYAKVGTAGYRVATEEDFAAVAVSLSGTSSEQFGVTTTASDLTTKQFSEITMIDDNGDGVWDRAIYIPYSVGQYTTYTSNNYRWYYEKSDATTSKEKTASPRVNGNHLQYWGFGVDDGKWDLRGNGNSQGTKGYILQKDLIWTEATELYDGGTPANKDYIVYYYNPYSRVFTVVENLGAAKSGVVTNVTTGTYAYDEDGLGEDQGCYYQKNATVTIDGVTYPIGYRGWTTGSQKLNSATTGYDLIAVDGSIGKYGYSEAIYSSIEGNAYRTMSYVVLAGRVIKASMNGNYCGWMAFDYGYYTKNTTGYTSYEYTGDIYGVDADGNILVKAYVDGGTGDQEIVKISSINGYNYGLLVEDYAALQFQFSGIGILNTTAAFETMKKAVICDFFNTLTADLNNGAQNTATAERQRVFIVAGQDADGAYAIYTDLNLYWGDENVNKYRQPGTISQSATITFRYGISDAEVTNSDDDDVILQLNKDTVILVAGTDGLKVATGIPAYGKKITFKVGSTQKAFAYEITNDFIFVASAEMTCAQIYDGEFDAAKNENAYNYYMVVGEFDDYDTTDYTTATYLGNGEYKYNKLFCLNTNSTATKTVVGGLEGYKFTSIYGHDADKPLGAIYAEKNGEYTLLTTLATATDNILVKYKYAVDSQAILEALLSENGYTAPNGKHYAGVYEENDEIEKASPTGFSLFLKNDTDIYENFELTYKKISYTWVDGVLTAVTNSGSKDTTAWGSGNLFYTYDADNDKFQGLIVAGTAPVIGLDKVKADAVEALEDLVANYGFELTDTCVHGLTFQDHVDAYEGLIDNCADEDAVETLLEEKLEKFETECLELTQDAIDATTVAISDVAANSFVLANAADGATELVRINVVGENGSVAYLNFAGGNGETCTYNELTYTLNIARNTDGDRVFSITAINVDFETVPVFAADTTYKVFVKIAGVDMYSFADVELTPAA